MRKRLIEIDEQEYKLLTGLMANEITRLKETGLRTFSRQDLEQAVDYMERLGVKIAGATSFIED